MNIRLTLPAVLALGLVGSGLALGSSADVHTARRTELGDVSLLTLEGEAVRLGDLMAGSTTVITYTGVGCPISNKLASRLEQMSQEYAAEGVRFLAVNANPQDSRQDIATEARELGLTVPLYKDFRQELTNTLGATTTTEVFLFDAQGQLRYQGAVDDQYSLGAAKPKPTRHYLASAIAAVLAGKDPEPAKTDAPGCKLTRLPEEELAEAITWTRDIAPIIRNNCESCHRPGQVGPFALQSYDQAKGWGAMIASVVEEERMPPWNATHDYDGVFANERGLTKKEKKKILSWVEDGMPRGDDKDLGPAEWPEGWRIGEPDVIYTMDEFMFAGQQGELTEAGYRVPLDGVVDYIFFKTKTEFSEDRWIRAMEIMPGAPDVVHHVLVLVDDPADGPLNLNNQDDFMNYLAVAVPGDTPSVYPEGYAKRLPAGATLIFQLHYTPNGKERFDRSELALIFADEPPIFEVHSDAVIDTRLRIPAGDPNFEVRDKLLLIEDTGVISFFPHMHTRGKDFKYIAHYPGGESEELLFSDYDFNWQESYIYHDPKLLPAGTTIECIAHYDNSADNPNNPDPDHDVYWGDQTFEEMFVGYFDYVVPLDE